MKFNYAFRKREFDREWDRIEKLCLAEGISAEAIAEARKETWEEVKSDRRFARHMHSAAPNGSWCGDQRQLSAANGTLN